MIYTGRLHQVDNMLLGLFIDRGAQDFWNVFLVSSLHIREHKPLLWVRHCAQCCLETPQSLQWPYETHSTLTSHALTCVSDIREGNRLTQSHKWEDMDLNPVLWSQLEYFPLCMLHATQMWVDSRYCEGLDKTKSITSKDYNSTHPPLKESNMMFPFDVDN